MPSKTEKQHRAMEAAAHGKSTLGIPQSVGKDFVDADKGRKITEQADHFHVESAHGPFRIAKRGLHPATVKMIQKMATGGKVEDDSMGTVLGPAGTESYLKGFGSDGSDEMAVVPPTEAAPGANDNASPLVPVSGFENYQPGGREGGGIQGGLVGETPSSSQTLGPPMGAQAEQPPGAPEMPALGQMVAPKLQNVTEEERGIMASANAARDANTAAHKEATGEYNAAQDAKIKGENDMRVAEESFYKDMNQKQTALRDDIMNSKIDPNKYWTDKGAGGRVAGAIGLLLSGIGSGLTHSPNLAMEVIQKGIDREIDSQKANLHKKEGMLYDTYRQTGDFRLAQQMTRQSLTNIALAQMNKAAASSQNADVKMRNQIASQAGLLSLEQQTRETANQQAILNANARNANTAAGNQLAMATYSGQMAAGARPREMQGKTIGNLNSVLNDLKDHMELLGKGAQGPVSGRLAQWNPWDEFTATAGASAHAMAEKLASAIGQGVASDARIKAIEPLVPSPTDLPARALEKRKSLVKYIESQRDEYIRQQEAVGFRIGPTQPIERKPEAPTRK